MLPVPCRQVADKIVLNLCFNGDEKCYLLENDANDNKLKENHTKVQHIHYSKYVFCCVSDEKLCEL